jgi:hypothetical protein
MRIHKLARGAGCFVVFAAFSLGMSQPLASAAADSTGPESSPDDVTWTQGRDDVTWTSVPDDVTWTSVPDEATWTSVPDDVTWT